jgi:arylsulfatase A-like enzyme
MPTATFSLLNTSRFACRLFARISAVAAVACLATAGDHLAAAEPAKPNVVLIFADDLGWQETGFSGSDYHETPNLDRLAREGMVFTQAYAAAGNCQPSRACLISGQYTPRHGVYAVGSTKRGPVEMMRLLPIPNKDGLAPTDFTLPKAMKSAGYATGMFGKWHLSGAGGSRPEDHFDVVGVSGHSWGKKNDNDPKGLFAITDEACRFIESNKDKPFFAYLPHYAIHSPIQSRPETLAHFKQKTPGKLHGDPEVAACLRDLDTGVGSVLDKLKELGLQENTLVLFTSDNGGTHFSQEPLRGKKGCYYEGGIREPMIVRWPAVVKPGTTCDVPVINVDFYATFAAAAGVKLPSDRPLDGASLLPLFAGEKSLKREAIFWHFPGYLDGPVPRGRDEVFRTRPVSVIRKGDWKLHLYHEEWKLDVGRKTEGGLPAAELYNIAEDPREEHDLAATNPDRRAELLADLLEWSVKTGAKRCTEANPAYRADATKAKAKVKKRDKK